MYKDSNERIKTAGNKNIHNDKIIEKYCAHAVKNGATAARIVLPSSVVTSEWVRWKCQFGCPVYGMRHCCPPEKQKKLSK